jgi:hypothetical protein
MRTLIQAASRRSIILGAAALLLAAAPLAAQARVPEAAARAFFSALGQRRWIDAARLVDPEARQRLKQGELRFAQEVARGPRIPTVDDLLKRDPGLPRSVAEYQVQQQQKMIKQMSDPIGDELTNVRSADDLEALSDLEVVARWLEAHDVLYQAKRVAAMRGEQIPPDALDDLQRNPPRYEVVGGVLDGEDTAQVVFRTIRPVGPIPSDAPPEVQEQIQEASRQVDVLTLRRSGSSWVVAMPSQGFDFLRSELSFGDQGQGPPDRQR